jgi:hypothetical protein
MPTNNSNSREARFNEKMIELRIRFWTNDISETRTEIIPKQAWDSGVVIMERNASHDIQPEKPKHFHFLMELPAIVKKVLIEHRVKLRKGAKSKKYYVPGH